jgi:hypothetical protein
MVCALVVDIDVEAGAPMWCGRGFSTLYHGCVLRAIVHWSGQIKCNAPREAGALHFTSELCAQISPQLLLQFLHNPALGLGCVVVGQGTIRGLEGKRIGQAFLAGVDLAAPVDVEEANIGQ